MTVDIGNVADAAIMTALNVTAVTTVATGGVHRVRAPKDTTGTWIVFRRVDSPPELRTLRSAAGATGRVARLRYQLQAVTQGLSAVAPEQALAAADGVLDDQTLTVTAGTFLSCRRERLLGVLTDDVAGGVPYQIVGAHYLVEVQIS